MYDWVIIGGGIHGCVIAHALQQYAEVPSAQVRIVDPHPSPLAVWKRRTFNCGMRYLRSPAAHAAIPDFTALLRWARRHGYDRREHTIPPYARPSLELFNAHADAMIEQTGLRAIWTAARARDIQRSTGPGSNAPSWNVHLDNGRRVVSRNVILAPGRSDGACIPEWATREPDRIHHVLDPCFDRDALERSTAPVIVGGGVSAVHLALHLANSGGSVRLIARHPLRIHQFDSDPCYIGPRCMNDFLARSHTDRRTVLNTVRNPGSIPPDLFAELVRARNLGSVELITDYIRDAHRLPDGTVELESERQRYRSDRVTLATGFAPGPPGGELRASAAAGRATGSPLPVDPDGYPVPDAALQWADGLFVAGSLGEQELGPSAANIVGAHNAAKRITAYLAGEPRSVPTAWRRYARASVSSSSDSS